MGKRTQTVITLQLKVTVPENSNTAEVMEKVRDAVGRIVGFAPEDITTKLVKKETTYN